MYIYNIWKFIHSKLVNGSVKRSFREDGSKQTFREINFFNINLINTFSMIHFGLHIQWILDIVQLFRQI